MNIVGLITEYNPFHNGHLYHIQEAKRVTKADATVVIMSGNFVQRGAPAIMPKHLRAKSALLSGADLVLELPVCFATVVQSFLLWGLSLCLTVWDVLTPSASEASAETVRFSKKLQRFYQKNRTIIKKHFKMLYAKGCHSHRQGRLLSLNISTCFLPILTAFLL